MKKVLFLLLFCTLGMHSYAADYFRVDNLRYNILDSDAATVEVRDNGTVSGALIIPDTVRDTATDKLYRVVRIADGGFDGQKTITSLAISNSVHEIGKTAFDNCTALSTISFSDSLNQVGVSAFRNTAWYDALPSGVVYIGKVLYNYNGEMPSGTAIIVSEGTVSISPSALYGCKGLISITIPTSLREIGESAFYYANNLAQVIGADSLEHIGADAFVYTAWYGALPLGEVYLGKVLYRYNNLNNPMPENTTIEVRAGTQSISPKAFYGCSGLASITFPESLTEIGASSFFGCSSLTEITIPRGVTSIGGSALKDCTNITSLNFQAKRCADFTYDTFSSCNLNEVVIGAEVERIPSYLLYNQTDLTSVTLPNTVRYIGQNAFSGCSELRDFHWPTSLEYIGFQAFYGCAQLKKVTIPTELASLETSPFGGCIGVDTLIYNARNCEWVDNYGSPFRDFACSTLSIGNEVEVLPICIFKGQSNITHVSIPSSVTKVSSYAFKECTALQKLTIESDSVSVGLASSVSDRHVFIGCNALDTLVFGEDIRWIELSDYCFSGASISTILYNSEAIDTFLCSDSYHNIQGAGLADSTTTIIIGENVKSIPATPFVRLEKVDSVTLPAGIEYVHPMAFSRLTAIKNASLLDFSTAFTSSGRMIPESAAYFYDFDKDGKMEVVQPLRGGACIGSYTGLLTNKFLVEGLINPSDCPDLLTVDNVFRDDDAEVVIKDYNQWQIIDSKDGSIDEAFEMPDNTIRDEHTLSFDANADGRTDYLILSNTSDYLPLELHIAYQQADGSFVRKPVEVVTDSTLIGELAFAQFKSSPAAPSGRRFNVWGGGTGIGLYKSAPMPTKAAETNEVSLRTSEMFPQTNIQPQAIDLNMDGLLDMINLEDNTALISLGNEKYYNGYLYGKVIAKDLTGDGMLDYIVYNSSAKKVSLLLYKGEEQFEEQELFQNMAISGIYSYDFDKDEDVDILLTFDYNASVGAAFCVFFENVNNKFKLREESLMGQFYLKDLKDFDNDGVYELLAIKEDQENDNDYYHLVECTPDFTIELDEEPFFVGDYEFHYDHYTQDPSPISGDVDNDGLIETYINGVYDKAWDYTPKMIGCICTTQRNTAPEQMASPRVIHDRDNELVRIEWNLGKDAQQSPVDLTYALRIGTSPTSGDVFYAHATEDGKRLRLGEGNVGYNLYQYFITSSWTKGTYYASVQAVDANGMGGAWSDPVVFEIESQSSSFDLPTAHITINDTLHLKSKAIYNPLNTYTWDFGADAQLVEEDEQGNWYVTYSSAGKKNITLHIASPDSDEVSESTSQELFVSGMRVDYRANKITGTLADIDLDGSVDLFGVVEGIGSGVFENDGEGNFTKVVKTYNLDMNMYSWSTPSPIACDINQDGLVDFVAKSGKGNGANVFINTGRFNFEVETRDFVFLRTDDTPVTIYYKDEELYDPDNYKDWNHDGYLDFWYRYGNDYGLYLNQGDYQTFKRATESFVTPKSDNVYDINNDGYEDFIEVEASEVVGSSSQETYTSSILLGDAFGDTTKTVDLHVGDSLTRIVDYAGYYDFDNNGYLDLQKAKFIWDGSYLYLSKAAICYFYDGLRFEMAPMNEVRSDGVDEIMDSQQLFADINGDGRPDFEDANMVSKIENQAPSAPTHVRTTQTAEGLTLSWDAAQDKETPKALMRYNISLKKKDAEGDGAYILSPLNEGKDGIPTINTHNYQRATQFTIPYENLTAGEEYELKVQAIDLWNATSLFSETHTFSLTDELFVVAERAELAEQQEVSITATGTVAQEGTPTWSVDGGSIVSTDGNTIKVVWNEEGVKQVSVTMNGETAQTSILVRPSMNLQFTIPSTVLSGGYVYFTLPEAFADERNDIRVQTSFMPDRSYDVASFDVDAVVSAVPDVEVLQDTLIVERRGNTLEARMLAVAEDGVYWIEFVGKDKTFGVVSCRQSFNVIGKNVTPQIGIVGIDAVTGKSKIEWEKPSDIDLQSGIYEKVVILKEVGATNNYEVLDEVDVNTTSYVDVTSNPFVRKGRYRLALRTSFGMMSNPSKVHSNVHIMLNRGAMPNSVNIVWTSYEGAVIDQYTILRGTSPDNMQVLTTASGYEGSYTDFGVPDGDVYYALEYTNTYENSWNSVPALQTIRQRTKGLNASKTGRSTALNANSAVDVRMAEILNVYCLQDEMVLTPMQEYLYLYAEVLPSMTTYRTVNWRIVEGGNYATVDQSGVVRYCGNGKNGEVVVEAVTIDGSGLSKQIHLSADGFKEESLLSPETEANPIAIAVDKQQLIISGAENENIAIYTIDGTLVRYVQKVSLVERISVSHSGIYIVCTQRGTYKCIVP